MCFMVRQQMIYAGGYALWIVKRYDFQEKAMSVFSIFVKIN